MVGPAQQASVNTAVNESSKPHVVSNAHRPNDSHLLGHRCLAFEPGRVLLLSLTPGLT